MRGHPTIRGRGIVKPEDVDQTGPGFEDASAAAANAPAADGTFGDVFSGWDAVLLEEEAIRTPVVAETEEQFLQAGQDTPAAYLDRGRNQSGQAGCLGYRQETSAHRGL